MAFDYDKIGKTFGKLTVLRLSSKRSPRGKRTVPMWECRCECGAITYKAADTLSNSSVSMCAECAKKYSAEVARAHAGFIDGTQLCKISNLKPTAANTSGVRGVYYNKKTKRYVAHLKFKGKDIRLGSHSKFENAVAARKKAEEKYFGAFIEEYKRRTDDSSTPDESALAVE